MTSDLYSEQETIEQQCRADTQLRFQNELTKKIQKADEASTFYGTSLLKRAIEPMADVITANRKAVKKGKAMNAGKAFKLLEGLKAEHIAFFACQVIIDRITTNTRMQDVAIRIGQRCESELRYIAFQREHPALFNKILTETTTGGKRKHATIIAAQNRYAAERWNSWSKVDSLHVGQKLLNIFTEATGFVEEHTSTARGKNKTDKHIKPTKAVCDFIESNRDAAALLNPIHLPMVVPPVDWESPSSGGYLTHHTPQLPFIKVRGNAQARNYLADLHGQTEEMKPVYNAVNAIQRTPWKINSFVYETFKQVYETGLPIAGLPSREDIPLPPSPLDPEQKSKDLSDAEKRKFKAFKKKRAKVYDANIALKSKRLMTSKIAYLAEKYLPYDAHYYPHYLDFRGRAYPAPMFLNPQGNSLAKGLLQFAEGKALGSNEAAYELAVHGANCYGYDKGTLDERIDWVEQNADRIFQVAADPMADLWWAKEADSPWCFLAFAKEWEGFYRDGYSHISHIPIAKDGSCSGLQHFSAALRDPIGALATNLIPADRPEDVYQRVINLAKDKVTSDLSGPNAEIAQLCLDYGLSRKAAKRCTMTRVYGSTQFSSRVFVEEYFQDTDAKRKQEDPSYVSILDGREFEASLYLTEHIWESINETVVAAKEGMDWLQECAKILAQENLPIIWTTLDGLPVMQSYPDTSRRRVQTKFGEKIVFLSVREDKIGTINKKKQGNSISPNWVHGNDACHLRMTVNLAAAHGVSSFAMIHDSFGTHAADIPLLSRCLRETFIDLYLDNDPIEMFRAETQMLTTTTLPKPPLKGDLDLTAVRNSEFFFA